MNKFVWTLYLVDAKGRKRAHCRKNTKAECVAVKRALKSNDKTVKTALVKYARPSIPMARITIGSNLGEESVNVRRYTKPGDLVITKAHLEDSHFGKFVITHTKSGRKIGRFFRSLKKARNALATILPLADWSQDVEYYQSRPELGEQVKEITNLYN